MSDTVNSIKGLLTPTGKLPYGILPIVAERCGVSKGYVSAVWRGQRKNNKVLATLIWELEILKQEEKEVEKKLNSL